MKPGPKPKCTPEIVERIAEMLERDIPLTRICQEDWAPVRSTVLKAADENPEIRTILARARDVSAEAIEDRIQAIEDDVYYGELEPQAAQVLLSSMRWRAKVHAPKRYGDKVDLNHKGNVTTTVKIVKFSQDYQPDEPIDGA
jgi:hypothetical protein